jgi:hypothetical protein
MCADRQATRGHDSGPYGVMTRAKMRAYLDLLPTWTLEQKAAADRQLIAVMRQRLAAGEEVPRMYQEPRLAGWSAKPRPPRSWWPGGMRHRGATADRLMARPHYGLCGVKRRRFSGLIDAQLATSSVSTVDCWNRGYPLVAASRRTPSSLA